MSFRTGYLTDTGKCALPVVGYEFIEMLNGRITSYPVMRDPTSEAR